MKLTTELLLAFIGGQMETLNPLSQHHYVGQLKEAVIDEHYELHVTFDWLAQGVGELPHKMYVAVNVHPLVWRRNITPFTVFDIGKDGFRLSSGLGQESVFFFPPGYYKNISPSMVEGLAIPA